MLGLGIGLVGLGLGLAIQGSRVFLPRLAIHTATGKASRVYSISLTFYAFCPQPN